MLSFEDHKALLTILQRCQQLVSESVDSDWSHMDAADIFETLDLCSRRLEAAQPINKSDLGRLFAPTGAMQEISIRNGWAEEFLELAQRFDATFAKMA